MLRWVENKQESNQSAINTATLQTCWVFFLFVFFVQSRDLTTGSSAVAAQPNSPFVPVSTRWDGETKKALIRTERRAEEVGGEAALYSSCDPPPSAQLLPGLEVVFRGP